ncbi:BAD_collapsed_G0048520.mRNA.1.CDS.1 [Saccharomyces cerevisiae]|nr:BAD_collapsed_G0048520.mRNA.1.CDS.1 [Saccharomyces cerevisiae]
MKVSNERKFEKANFDEFESALNNKNDLVHCPSITLFESIPTEFSVILRRRKSGLIKVEKDISLVVKEKAQRFVEDEPDFQTDQSVQTNQVMVYMLFQVHTLKSIPFLFLPSTEDTIMS